MELEKTKGLNVTQRIYDQLWSLKSTDRKSMSAVVEYLLLRNRELTNVEKYFGHQVGKLRMEGKLAA